MIFFIGSLEIIHHWSLLLLLSLFHWSLCIFISIGPPFPNFIDVFLYSIYYCHYHIIRVYGWNLLSRFPLQIDEQTMAILSQLKFLLIFNNLNCSKKIVSSFFKCTQLNWCHGAIESNNSLPRSVHFENFLSCLQNCSSSTASMRVSVADGEFMFHYIRYIWSE